MTYQPPQPPFVDGICAFVDNDPICMAVQTELTTIRSAFQPSADQQVCDTFYITATYNRTIAGTALPSPQTGTFPVINGDTCEHCLSLTDNPPMGV